MTSAKRHNLAAVPVERRSVMDGSEMHLLSVGIGEIHGQKKVSVVLAGVGVLFGPVSARTIAAQLVQWAEYIETHEPGPVVNYVVDPAQPV